MTSDRIDPTPPRWLWAGLVGWLLVLVGGFGIVLGYEFGPGGEPRPGTHWPSGSEVPRSDVHPTLVVFLHPHCPCSAASVNQLQRIAALTTVPIQGQVVFYAPADASEGWVQGDLIDAARRLPGFEVRFDEAGVEARLHGALTSGHALLYAADSALLFSGGITNSRGHQGDSAGQNAILCAAASGVPVGHSTPVFGCDFFE